MIVMSWDKKDTAGILAIIIAVLTAIVGVLDRDSEKEKRVNR